MNSSPILISLGISAGITILSVSLEYALSKRSNEQVVARSRIVPPLLSPFAVGYLQGAGEYLIQHLESKSHRCDYCKTAQTIGEHCRNCGAPTS